MVFVAGEDLTAARLNEEIGIAKRKFTDQSVTTTTFVNDDTLTWPVAANTAYLFEFHLVYTGDVAGDLNVGWTYPAGSSMSWSIDGLGASLGYNNVGNIDGATNATFGAAGTGLGRLAHITGYLAVAGTAGNFLLRFARAAGSGTATVMRAGSFGVVFRV
jgi:hypothetical protein